MGLKSSGAACLSFLQAKQFHLAIQPHWSGKKWIHSHWAKPENPYKNTKQKLWMTR